MSVLTVDPSAPWYVKAAADTVLALHIGGGALGLLSGAVALAASKGGRLHAFAGSVFVVAMLVMASIGAVVSQMMGEPPNVIAGIMTFYLVLTAWLTVRGKGGVGAAEIGGLAAALAVCAAGAVFLRQALASPRGTVGQTPPQAFYVFLLVGGIAAAADLKVILTGGVSGVPRLARHLWRMCTALTIAAGSLFLGQQQVFPAELRGSPLLFLPVFAPLVLLVFWSVRIRLRGRRPAALIGRTAASASPLAGS